MRLVELGLGISVAPRAAVEAELARGTLHAVRIFGREQWRRLSLVYPAADPLAPAAEAFAELCRSMLGAARPSRQRSATGSRSGSRTTCT